MIFLIGLLALVVVTVFYMIGIYNSLIRLKNQVRNAWSQIDVQLKRRHDLIPNLVETAKGYLQHEKETLENITQARSQAMGAQGVGNKSAAEGALSGAMSKFFLVVENYPDLKANTNFIQLQGTLNEVEEQISAARRAYNAAVTELNNAVEMFPTNMIAPTMGLSRRQLFEIPDTERQNVNVGDLFNK